MSNPIIDQDGKELAAIPEKCPMCGGAVEMGFGLAGGGYGPYWFCDSEEAPGCLWFVKRQSEDDE